MSHVSKKLPAIKTERAYERALEEIYGLMDAEPDTPEDERLDALVDLVVAYEDKHYNPDVFMPRIIARNEFRETPLVAGTDASDCLLAEANVQVDAEVDATDAETSEGRQHEADDTSHGSC